MSIIALAKNQLAATNWTTLNIATKYMELAINNIAIMTWLAVCSPILRFLPIADATTLDATD